MGPLRLPMLFSRFKEPKRKEAIGNLPGVNAHKSNPPSSYRVTAACIPCKLKQFIVGVDVVVGSGLNVGVGITFRIGIVTVIPIGFDFHLGIIIQVAIELRQQLGLDRLLPLAIIGICSDEDATAWLEIALFPRALGQTACDLVQASTVISVAL